MAIEIPADVLADVDRVLAKVRNDYELFRGDLTGLRQRYGSREFAAVAFIHTNLREFEDREPGRAEFNRAISLLALAITEVLDLEALVPADRRWPGSLSISDETRGEQ